MWKGNITRKERIGPTLSIFITFTNGVDSFDEAYTTNVPFEENFIASTILNKIRQLNSLDSYEQSITDDKLVNSTYVIDGGQIVKEGKK